MTVFYYLDIVITREILNIFLNFQDLISKWEKYVQDHQAYENRLHEFNDWIKHADSKLQICQQSAADQETMEERRTMIQVGSIILFVTCQIFQVSNL